MKTKLMSTIQQIGVGAKAPIGSSCSRLRVVFNPCCCRRRSQGVRVQCAPEDLLGGGVLGMCAEMIVPFPQVAAGQPFLPPTTSLPSLLCSFGLGPQSKFCSWLQCKPVGGGDGGRDGFRRGWERERQRERERGREGGKLGVGEGGRKEARSWAIRFVSRSKASG